MPRKHQQKPCNTPECSRVRASRGRYCTECQRERARVDRTVGPSTRCSRECATCHKRRDISEFSRTGAMGSFHDSCERCRPLCDVSPDMAARRLIERTFGVPSDVWYLHEHPLNHLHYSWMVAINNARAQHGRPYHLHVPLHSDLDRLSIAFKRAVNAGFTPITAPATAPALQEAA